MNFQKPTLLYQPSFGYRVNSDTVFLYHFITTFSPKGNVLDVGCGVGVLGILLKRDFGVKITAIDKQTHMIAYTKRNFALHKADAKIVCADVLDAKIEKNHYDLVVCNPPFYHPDVDQSKDTILNTARYAHHMPFDLFSKRVGKFLKPKGRFVFCYDAKQIPSLLEALNACGLNPETIRFVHAKNDRESKLVLISARKGGKGMLRVLPPLVVFDEDGSYTQEAKKAFEVTATHFVSADISDISTV